MAEVGNDCYFYFYSTCLKGSHCRFRHCEAALGSETVCSLWREGTCVRPLCKFRHMETQKPCGIVPCFWENQPSGCTKISCCFHHSKPRCINGLFLPPSGNTNVKTETQEGTTADLTEDSQKTQENISRPVHPPLIITINLDDEEEEEEKEEEEEEEIYAYNLRTQTPEEVEEEKAIKEMCCKSGEYYRMSITHEDHVATSTVSPASEHKLLKPLEAGRDLQEGDGLAVPSKLSVFEGRKAATAFEGITKTDLGAIEKGGGDCYVTQNNRYSKPHKSDSSTEKYKLRGSKYPFARAKDANKALKKRFYEGLGNKEQIDKESQRPSSAYKKREDTVKMPHLTPSLPTGSLTKGNEVNTTINDMVESKENPSTTMNDIEPAKKENFKRVRKKQWVYEAPRIFPTPQTGKDNMLLRHPKAKASYQRFGERNHRKIIENSYFPTLKGVVRNTFQNPSAPNRSLTTSREPNETVGTAEEYKLNHSLDQSSSVCYTPSGWRKKLKGAAPSSKTEKVYSDNWNNSSYITPAWRKRISHTKPDYNAEKMQTASFINMESEAAIAGEALIKVFTAKMR
ncbi:uncharacterized protein C12orf50 homolog [Microcaecilia unicolor]|uniref:Uncharacterized protein C12orf50 homolog n=1 Tax=Microcaecilia unicolor TaxID=1415580 RepID=A0A6P7Z1W2_9AMPH|nr:uncharacterized protein C12orf50 homolog [Microcaecilia unicolor]